MIRTCRRSLTGPASRASHANSSLVAESPPVSRWRPRVGRICATEKLRVERRPTSRAAVTRSLGRLSSLVDRPVQQRSALSGQPTRILEAATDWHEMKTSGCRPTALLALTPLRCGDTYPARPHVRHRDRDSAHLHPRSRLRPGHAGRMATRTKAWIVVSQDAFFETGRRCARRSTLDPGLPRGRRSSNWPSRCGR
jgi:hypothetical protein